MEEQKTLLEIHEEIKVIILKEYKDMRTGDQYIENATDASRFLGRLVFLLTNGEEGEE